MRRLVAVAVPAVLVGLLAGTGAGAAAGVAVRTGAPAAPSGAGAPAYSETKQVTRSIVAGGEVVEVDSRQVTVTAGRTTDLRGRERIDIAWSGAHPTGGRAASPFGELGMAQEYPVVILQCRGLDDPTLPLEQQLRPETCWTSTRAQRTQSVEESSAVWRHDRHATDPERAQKSGLAVLPPECGDTPAFSTHVTPFVAADGTVYPACTAETMPPEAAVGAAFPPAEMAAFTDVDGNGAVKFEVRSAVENESLGCSDKVDCSVVVIPIAGISCLDEDRACNAGGQFEPGSSNFANQGVDAAVSPLLWWSASNWRNRFSIPLTFGLPPDACDVLDSRPPTGFYGSELLAQAALQWSPAYCLDEDRFKFQHNKMPDEAGFALMENGGGAAALVSGPHEVSGTDPVAYAPTAVTGFAIGYVIDRPDNAGEFTELRLNARLLAKLLTQSYLGSERARTHEGMAANPTSINLDPEFQQLNPGLDTISREAAATVLSLSEGSDVLTALTAYIAQDKEAMAFVNGAKDPWGMTVNPSYRKIELPVAEWPLLDDFVAPSEQECYTQNPAPYFTQIAAPVSSLRKIAEAVLDAWPNVQTKCERSVVTDPWKIGRVDRQGVGTRFMLGLVSLGDARRLGLREATLATRGGTFVGPTESSLARAVSLATPSESGLEPFELDMAEVVAARAAYPGTMIVYTAARTANLPEEDAAKVAQFIDVATTEGQRRGYGNGELPPGYLPLARSGATAPLLRQAQAVSTAVAEQTGTVASDEDTAEEEPVDDAAPAVPQDLDGSLPGSVTDASPVDAGAVPDAAPTDGPTNAPTTGSEAAPQRIDMPATQAVSSPVASRLIPTLLGVALLGALAAGLLRLGTGRRSPQ